MTSSGASCASSWAASLAVSNDALPLRKLIGSGWPSTLRAHGRQSLQQGLTRSAGGGGALERCQSRRRRQQLAQDDRSRHANSLALEVELRDAVLTQGDERDPAEVGHNGALQHHFGQMVGCVARDVVEADAVSPGHTAMV